MIKTYIEKNNIYFMFNEFEKHIFEKISKLHLPDEVKVAIKEIFFRFEFEKFSLKKQKNFITNLTTYIDVVEKYNLFVYIIPKEIKLVNYQELSQKTFFEKVENLSIQIFLLYKQFFNKSSLKYKLLTEYKGNNFLDLKMEFYIERLNKLYSYLLNYKKHSKLKVICSDKIIGIEIEQLNYQETNPLKNYQFVRENYQKELVIFIYNLMRFLENNRLSIFKYHYKYNNLKYILNKIDNFLLKLSKNIKKEKLNNLKNFFDRYKNSKELQKNKQIFQILEELFFNELENGVVFFETIDLSKFFEKIVEKRLNSYENLFIGDESKGKIYSKNKTIKDNILMDNPKIKQYPDFMIFENGIYHIIDAKYKLKKSIFKSRDVFWQILIYSKLFNKNQDLQKVKKIIVYPNVLKIDISKEFKLKIQFEKIDIFFPTYKTNEFAFDSEIEFIEINIFDII